MGLGELTAESVNAAIAEYDELGADAFLSKYGYGPAPGYLIHYDGKLYDSKAIAGVAYGYIPGLNPLGSAEFSGGEASVARKLRQLGFRVPPTRSPDWVRDEVILACDLVAQNGWNYMSADDPRVVKLSGLLQRLPFHPVEVRGDKFRNTNGVARKTVDIAMHHPDYPGKTTKSGGIDEVVLHEFLDDPTGMHAIAEAMRRSIADDTVIEQSAVPSEDEDDGAREGRLLQRRHFVRERDKKLRRRKIAEFLKVHDRVHCQACGFDFEAVYGGRGQGYIEVHHTLPLHAADERQTELTDLVLLCANCHRIVHNKSPWLTFDELRALAAP
ncbi:HNH endonuclease [Tsukamurella soli]